MQRLALPCLLATVSTKRFTIQQNCGVVKFWPIKAQKQLLPMAAAFCVTTHATRPSVMRHWVGVAEPTCAQKPSVPRAVLAKPPICANAPKAHARETALARR